MTENRQLMIAVLGNNIKGDHVPYYSVYEIECALETAYTLAGIYKDLKKVPSSQQIQCTLQDLIAEGLVVTSILPAHVDSDIMIDYYALISEYEVTRNKLIVKCLSFDSQVDPVKFAFYIFGIFSFYDPRIHIISATPFKKVRWYSFRRPKQKTKEVSNANNIYPSNPRRKIPYLHRA